MLHAWLNIDYFILNLLTRIYADVEVFTQLVLPTFIPAGLRRENVASNTDARSHTTEHPFNNLIVHILSFYFGRTKLRRRVQDDAAHAFRLAYSKEYVRRS
jgi:hypothetical protein